MAEVRTIAVIGAGAIGRGIAHAAALGGYRTILEDIVPASLRRAEAEVRRNLAQAVESGEVRKEDADAVFIRIEYASTVEQAAREATWSLKPCRMKWNPRLRSLPCWTRSASPAPSWLQTHLP